MGLIIQSTNSGKVIPVGQLIRCRERKYWHHSGYCKLIGKQIDKDSDDYCSAAKRKGIIA